MKNTTHRVFYNNSKNMEQLADNTINLIVTSPPYPMIEMWDETFGSQNPRIRQYLNEKDGLSSFELMHCELDKVWKDCNRVLNDGGFLCINIGDAVRKINDDFCLYPNSSRIIDCCLSIGMKVLPEIIWRKQSNKPNKFMGSGMYPAGAYVTLEHEHILIFRKGNKRLFKTSEAKENRHKSAFFWEERNLWFSDIWNDLKGVSQKLMHEELRKRSAAFPFELAYRLINMYSVQFDTVLDPFLGTGTTSLAAMVSARNSVGYEIDEEFSFIVKNRLLNSKNSANEIIFEREKRHATFIQSTKTPLKYKTKKGIPVVTRQEVGIDFPYIGKISQVDTSTFQVEYCDEVIGYPQPSISCY